MSFRSRTIRRRYARTSKRLSTSRFFPLCSWNSAVEKAHGRIEWRAIDVLPAEAAGIQGEWPTVRQICRVIRSRQVKKNAEWQKPQHEVVYLVSSSPASPQALLGVNRDHWRIEIMHRNKDVILGEDGYTNRCELRQEIETAFNEPGEPPGFDLAYRLLNMRDQIVANGFLFRQRVVNATEEVAHLHENVRGVVGAICMTVEV